MGGRGEVQEGAGRERNGTEREVQSSREKQEQRGQIGTVTARGEQTKQGRSSWERERGRAERARTEKREIKGRILGLRKVVHGKVETRKGQRTPERKECSLLVVNKGGKNKQQQETQLDIHPCLR